MYLPSEVVRAAKSSNEYELYKALLLNFGRRGEKAFEYVREGRVKKYRDFFVVVGKEEYIVEENSCTCPDFLVNLKGLKPCSHIIAVEVAKIIKSYDEIDTFYVDFVDDILKRKKY
ncbi:SWIM zinc finger family protein [Archaeoglobus neptunius]|uniref:SWIM zinc finger family protein n=1 Tax=Archaeoglobus neptunius TaxID=2798580 RepID=UPI0019266F4A|nr:SWIM zinc finger family protein [Archaeoglobus neptunius]